MKSLILYASLVGCVIGIPQRGGSCPCPDVICPKYGREACECMNRAAQDCHRMWVQARNPSCSQPTPLNCNGPPQRPPPTTSSRPPVTGPTGFTTYYSVVPFRTTITTTLPGFGWPNPVTSYSYSMSTTTITLINPPGGAPNSQWTQSQPWPWNRPWSSTASGPKHRTTTVTISATKTSPRPSIPTEVIGITTRTITITATLPISPPPISSSTSQSITWSPSTTVTIPWARSSDEPWSVPPKPPPDFTPSESVPLSSTLSKPSPWRPPPVPGGSWTSVSEPTLPVNPVITPKPSSSASKTIQTTQTTHNTTPTLGPPPPLPPVPPKCGPNMPKCTGNTYCDPQPLCSIGEDCPGVCLPILALDFVNGTQPWEVRRQVWQKLLDDGEFVLYRWVT